MTVTETRDSIDDIWGPRTPHVGVWPERVDERTLAQPERWVQSVCVLCSLGCGMDVGVANGQIVGVRGRADDRVNHGRLGPKGLHGWQANSSADRLTMPLVRRDGRLVPTTWDDAMDLIVRRSKADIERYGPGSHAFYNSGQLFLEEYYTLAIVADAGVRTNHLDGNTRLCTATAAVALIESFGTDGAPGSYTDFDLTDAIFLVGHNMPSTQTVLWARVLDRLDGPRPPKLVVVDPRLTQAARRADVHLAPRPGTNLPLMNGILRILIERGWVDSNFIRDHTVDFETLVESTSPWTPERVEAVTDVPSDRLLAAAEILGTSRTLVSTCLQGVYQSLQATATAVQVNNLHLIRGLIGKPGATVFQMNGQPTAQNTRECGANGEFVAFRNWQNPEHLRQTAEVWNVEASRLPSWTPPTHAMQIFHLAETGSIRLLWIMATNPAVSTPELARIRHTLSKDELFVIVSDAFLTETAQLADVVLPAAIWGEKTGCTTNAERTVHLSEQAIEPPGEARADLDILIDYARRMDFRDKDGEPLVKWTDAAGAFESWRQCSEGRPCDYSGMSHELLRLHGPIQWPCNARYPLGKERQYEDGVFNTAAEYCETYGHDLATGAAIEPEQYAARDPGGRAVIKGAEYFPPPEEPDAAYPLLLTTGRVVHHFHTRTKTGRSPELNAAAPRAFVEMAKADAERLGIVDGDLVEVRSRRGHVVVPAHLTGIEPGVVFVPFHYGDEGDASGAAPTAANRLTMSGWDPVSKQPHFKYAAVSIRPVAPVGDRARGSGPTALAGRRPGRIRGRTGLPDEARESVTPGREPVSRGENRP
ncbi:MAG TPA: nitrate reductase [Candidatus Limnocylindrales bacterium]|nr:nitrate reductase [Candidatus Limnocylindrales bacterium]